MISRISLQTSDAEDEQQSHSDGSGQRGRSPFLSGFYRGLRPESASVMITHSHYCDLLLTLTSWHQTVVEIQCMK